LGNLPKTRVGRISEKTGGIGIGLPFRRVQSILDPFVETVRHPVPGKFPVVSERNIRPAVDAEVFFPAAEHSSAGEACSREEKIQKSYNIDVYGQ